MAVDKEALEKRIAEIEKEMSGANFWGNKDRAQDAIKEHNELKTRMSGLGKYDKGSAHITIFSGAGGDDAEDFSRMLFEMYQKYVQKNGWELYILHKNENDHGGYRNITAEISGSNVYGTLKNESGVHRLVRVSPFSAKKLRHTSFAMVEIVPILPKQESIEIPESEIRIEFARSSGPGGQNVNKRETAVRIVHIYTNLSAHVDSERSQAQNREKALAILKGKLFRLEEEKQMKEEANFHISKTTQAQWGSQIRSYVLHPYKMVKDHRTNVEMRDVESVLNGELDKFIEKEKDL